MTTIDHRSLDQLSELIGGDKETLHELISTFLEEGTEIVASMNASLANKDLDVLRRGAHSMKSSAQDFGAKTLSEMNASLESQCKNEWPDNAAAQLEDISKQFSAAHTELQNYIDSN